MMTNPNFKIGDKVKAVKASQNTYWYAGMIGNVFTVDQIDNDGDLRIEGLPLHFLKVEDVALFVCNGVDKNGNPYHFTKDMLKTGMGVAYRNGKTRLVIDGRYVS